MPAEIDKLIAQARGRIGGELAHTNGWKNFRSSSLSKPRITAGLPSENQL